VSGPLISPPRPAVSSRQVVLVALALVVGFVFVRLVLATSVAGFTVAGDRFVDPALTPERLPVTHESGGYDGQFVYRLALEPWTQQRTDYGITLDNPAYRQQRIATPALAWAVGLLPGVSTVLALLLVNVAALTVAAAFAVRLAVALGRHPLTGLVLAVPAGMPISLGRDLTEPVAWAAVLAGLWYARQQRWPATAAALTVAVLARETSLVVVAGLVAAQLWRLLCRDPRGNRRALAWLAVPAVTAVAWQLVLLRAWGVLPVRSGGATSFAGLPVLRVLDTLAAGVPGPPVLTAVVTAERDRRAGAVRLRGRGPGHPPGQRDRRRGGRLGAVRPAGCGGRRLDQRRAVPARGQRGDRAVRPGRAGRPAVAGRLVGIAAGRGDDLRRGAGVCAAAVSGDPGLTGVMAESGRTELWSGRRGDDSERMPEITLAAGLSIRGLTKSYGPVRAVAGIDLDIVAGETVALLGPNGAGKSTTIDMLLGLARPDAGAVTVFGRTPRRPCGPASSARCCRAAACSRG
jgi:ABC-type multidrug transport system fused ATPase/permease subunit